LRVSEHTLRAWIYRKDNPLPCIRAPRGGRLWFPIDALRRWVNDEQWGSTPREL